MVVTVLEDSVHQLSVLGAIMPPIGKPSATSDVSIYMYVCCMCVLCIHMYIHTLYAYIHTYLHAHTYI